MYVVPLQLHLPPSSPVVKEQNDLDLALLHLKSQTPAKHILNTLKSKLGDRAEQLEFRRESQSTSTYQQQILHTGDTESLDVYTPIGILSCLYYTMYKVAYQAGPQACIMYKSVYHPPGPQACMMLKFVYHPPGLKVCRIF